MKKLLITTMAAVSVGLCAKAADDGFISGTSFETVPEKSYLATNGETTLCNWYGEAGSVLSDDNSTDPELRGRYWMTEATDAQLVVSNVTNFAGDYLSTDNRPQQWRDGDNTKALYIDTDKPLMRYVNPSTDGKTAAGADLNQDIFFDSVVQFTATDVAAEPESGDKLRVWLYTSPENLDGTVFGEEEAITRLVVTAGYYKPQDKTTYKTNYLTNVSISPDSWHRLTIKTFVEGGYTKFNIYVDGDIVKVGELQDFDCLYKVDGQDTLQCVAFDGKGAVDDIVFTTKDPFYVPPVVAEKVNVSVSINDFGAIFMATLDSEQITSGSASYEFDKGTTLKLMFMLNEGYELVSSSPVASNDNGIYSITVVPNSNVTVEIVVRKAGGGEVVTYPTVKPNGDSTTQETLSASAAAAIEAALAGVETMPDALTVIVNEKEYFGDEAVAKINEVVMMFESVEEEKPLKFFDASGIMKVSFKATNPLMETETAEATDYEAMVGESVATVTSKYTVNKETVDLTPGVTGENEAVTFKLVIKPVSSTGSDTGSAVQE